MADKEVRSAVWLSEEFDRRLVASHPNNPIRGVSILRMGDGNWEVEIYPNCTDDVQALQADKIVEAMLAEFLLDE